jgi:hypothetical protein
VDPDTIGFILGVLFGVTWGLAFMALVKYVFFGGKA